MKFELNEYRQCLTDETILADIKTVARLLAVDYLPISLYKKHGKYSQCAIQGHFGTWKKALSLAGLRNTRNAAELKLVSDEEYFSDARRVAQINNSTTVLLADYTKLGKYSTGNVFNRFGAWDDFLTRAGLQPTGLAKKRVTEKECFEEIERIWVLLGRQPTATDLIKRKISCYSIDTYKRRFGGWRKALEAFVSYVNSEGRNEGEGPNSAVRTHKILKGSQSSSVTTKENVSSFEREHRTSRNVNARLRFRVLQRDHFKCCCCGASPAKDSSVVLQVDHIVPWAKGGETIIENLQTLCAKCNLGKSDLV